MYALARRSLIAARDIPVGAVITREDVVVKRPGYGIMPKHVDHVVGRRARMNIEEDDIITWEMV
jgi:sialic acid synthase SpsE